MYVICTLSMFLENGRANGNRRRMIPLPLVAACCKSLILRSFHSARCSLFCPVPAWRDMALHRKAPAGEITCRFSRGLFPHEGKLPGVAESEAAAPDQWPEGLRRRGDAPLLEAEGGRGNGLR